MKTNVPLIPLNGSLNVTQPSLSPVTTTAVETPLKSTPTEVCASQMPLESLLTPKEIVKNLCKMPPTNDVKCMNECETLNEKFDMCCVPIETNVII